jgi:hypothetical protein
MNQPARPPYTNQQKQPEQGSVDEELAAVVEQLRDASTSLAEIEGPQAARLKRELDAALRFAP